MATSIPEDFILQCFDAFDPAIAGSPYEILNHLSDYRRPGAIQPSRITTQTSQQGFVGETYESTSYQSTQTNQAQTAGLEASYGCFSGSVQTSHSKETWQAATTFNFGYLATLNCGTTYYNQDGDIDEVRQSLERALTNDLDAIASLQEAADFTRQYGTHLVLGVQLGGMLYVSTVAGTTTSETKETTSTTVTAKYESAATSMAATASVTNELVTQYETEDYQATLSAIGGSSNAAAQLDCADPATYGAWADTCTPETVCGLSKTKELWELAKDGSDARSLLKSYVRLRVLVQSLNNPTIVSQIVALGTGNAQTVAKVNTAGLEDGYKVVSGGALVTPTDATAYLYGSGPVLTSSGGRSSISGWEARCRDLYHASKPTDSLTVYALCVYDPEDLLDVVYDTNDVTFTAKGSARNSASFSTANAGAILVAGGTQSQGDGSEVKFIMSSYPEANDGDSWTQWTSHVADCHHACTNGTLTTTAIGVIAPNNVRIEQLTESSRSGTGHFDNAEVSLESAVIGGGVLVEIIDPGSGNLVQQSFPSSSNTWTEYNKSPSGAEDKSQAVATAFAIGLTATLVDDDGTPL